MKKYIIIWVTVLIGVLIIWFLISNESALTKEITDKVTNDLSSTSATSDTKVGGENEVKPITNVENKKIMNATIQTNKGKITIEFFGEQAPNTVANFTKLAKEGFYNGTKFHRVIKGFMIQGGDPLTKDDSKVNFWGTGGPGYSFPDELGSGNENNRNDVGTISMANAGPNTNGSQFFINVAPNNFLDTKHVVFGKVISGMDVVTKIENTPTTGAPSNRPTTAVVLESISLQ